MRDMMRAGGVCLLTLFSHWRRHPIQLFSILAGLWLATTLWSGVQALNEQARADYARASAVLTAPGRSQLVPRQGFVQQEVYVRLRRQGWPVSPVLEGQLRLAVQAPNERVRILGVDPLSLPGGTIMAGEAIESFELADFIGKPGQALIAPETLHRLGLKAGDTPLTSDGRRIPPLLPKPQLVPGLIVLDIGWAQQVLEAPGEVSRLLLAQDIHGKPRTLPAEFSSLLRYQPQQDAGDLERLTESFHLNLTALGMLSFIVGLLIVNASIGLAFEQRRGLLRTIQACGVSRGVLMCALAVELGCLALAGGLVGVGSGYLVAGALIGDVSSSLRGLYGAEVSGRLSLNPQWWLAGIGVCVLGGFVAGCGSFARAARMPLLAVAQPQAWRRKQALWSRRQTVAALALAIFAVLCWRFGDSLFLAFAMTAAVLFASALLLPALLDGALALALRRARRPLSQWFLADSRQQLPSLALALMALLLALAASVGVGSMTDGFRNTFRQWLDQRLVADLYITPEDTRQGRHMLGWLDNQPGVDAVLPNWRVDTRLGGWPVQMQGVVSHPRVRAQWPLLARDADAWHKLETGEGVMMSEQLARRLHLKLGDDIELTGDEGRLFLPIVGLYADYGNAKGHLLISADAMRHDWPEARLSSLNVYAASENVESLKSGLAQRYGLDRARLIEQAALKQTSLEVFERTFASTAALNALTLAVAGVELFISLLTLGQSRLQQLAPLWALGVRRSRLAWMSLGQTLMLAALTITLAIPLGILLAWSLVAVVNVQAFGWRLPLHVFPDKLVELALLGLITSLLAALWPVLSMMRRQPAELLRRFQ